MRYYSDLALDRKSPATKISDLDRIAADYIAADRLAEEPDLAATRYRIYRDLHPLEATIEFSKKYYDAYLNAYRENVCYQTVHFQKMRERSILSLGDPELAFRKIKNIARLWRARQAADALGMPYSTFAARALDIRMRHWRQRGLPQPNQLCTPWIIRLVEAGWKESCDAGVDYAPGESRDDTTPETILQRREQHDAATRAAPPISARALAAIYDNHDPRRWCWGRYYIEPTHRNQARPAACDGCPVRLQCRRLSVSFRRAEDDGPLMALGTLAELCAMGRVRLREMDDIERRFEWLIATSRARREARARYRKSTPGAAERAERRAAVDAALVGRMRPAENLKTIRQRRWRERKRLAAAKA